MESNKRLFEELEKIENPFKVNAIKEDETDKWVVTCGNIMAFPMKFDKQEDAENFIKTYLPKGYIFMAMSAFIVNIININEKIKKENK